MNFVVYMHCLINLYDSVVSLACFWDQINYKASKVCIEDSNVIVLMMLDWTLTDVDEAGLIENRRR